MKHSPLSSRLAVLDTYARRERLFLFHQGTRRQLALFDGMIVGRAGADENFPQDAWLSGKQCRFRINRLGEVFCQDVGTVTRTRINGRLLEENEERRLSGGDRLDIGRQTFLIAIAQADGPLPAHDADDGLDPEERTLQIVIEPKSPPRRSRLRDLFATLFLKKPFHK